MGSIRPPDPSYAAAPPPGEVPPAVAEAIDALARHRSAAAGYDDELRAAFVGRARPGAGAPAPRGRDEPSARALARIDGARMREAAIEAREAEAAARTALRRAVEWYARDLRRQGVPPERMIIAVKALVRRAAAAPQPLPEPEHLIPDLVQWSVAAYFAAD